MEHKNENEQKQIGLFNFDLSRERQELKKLEKKLSLLSDTPAQTFKILALDLLNHGDIERGIEFVTEALICDKDVFFSTEVVVRHCSDFSQLRRLNELLPHNLVLIADPSLEVDNSSVAAYYKSTAIELLDKGQLFKALKLIELSLGYDRNIFDIGEKINIRTEYEVLLLEEQMTTAPSSLEWMKSLGVDYACIETNSVRQCLANLEGIPQTMEPENPHRILFGQQNFPKEPLIHIAVRLGYRNLLTWLLDNGTSVDCLRYGGGTALIVASHYPNVEIVELLLERGAKVNHVCGKGLCSATTIPDDGRFTKIMNLVVKGVDYEWDKDCGGSTALHFAAGSGHLTIVQCLLKYSAINIKNKKGATPLQYALRMGHLEVIKCLIDSGEQLNDSIIGGITCLMLACQSGKLEVVNYLLSQNAEIAGLDIWGMTVLHYACIQEDPGFVKQILNNGRNMTLNVNQPSHEGVTPLMGACILGSLQVVEYLLSLNADIGIRDLNGRSVIHYASFAKHPRVLECLLNNDKGVCFNINEANEEGETPLILACRAGNVEVVDYLISLKAEIKVKDADGSTALHKAVGGNVAAAKYILESQQVTESTIDEPDNLGRTSLMLACLLCVLESVEYLVSRGAQVGKKDKEGRTAMHYAAWHGNAAMVKVLLHNSQSMDLLINEPNDKGETPLYKACMEGNLEVARCLLTLNADITRKDHFGLTAFHRACMYENDSIVGVLLNHTAQTKLMMNDTTEEGWTGLMFACACFHNRLSIVSLLIRNGADLEIKNGNGMSALIIAEEMKHTDIVRVLSEASAQYESPKPLPSIQAESPIAASTEFSQPSEGSIVTKAFKEEMFEEVVVVMTPVSVMTKSLLEMRQVLGNLSDAEKQSLISNYDFLEIDLNQLGRISEYFSTANFTSLRLINAKFFDLKILMKLLSNSDRPSSLTIVGNSLLTDSDIKYIMESDKLLKVEAISFEKIDAIQALSGRLGFSFATQLVRLSLSKCQMLKKVSLNAPKLKYAEFINCKDLHTFILEAIELEKLNFRQCGALKKISVDGKECTINVKNVGMEKMSDTKFATFFKNCRVKNIEYSVENDERSSRVRMFSLCGSASGSSWLFEKLLGRDTLCSNTKLGTDIQTLKDFQILGLSYQVVIFDHNNNVRFRENDLKDFKPAQVFIFSISFNSIGSSYSKKNLFSNPLLSFKDKFIEIKEKLNKSSVCILAGTKIDLCQSDGERKIFEQKLQRFAKEHGMLGPVLTSAKNNMGIEELRNLLKEAILLSEDKWFELGIF